MTSSDFVWQLVHSLSKKEIEWFYRVASIHQNRNPNEGTPAYMELFQTLREMDVYDESILKKAFPVGNFSELKGRIRDVVYKAIAFYNHTPHFLQSWLVMKKGSRNLVLTSLSTVSTSCSYWWSAFSIDNLKPKVPFDNCGG